MYTRCSSCGTTYRITGNQLAAAGGMVGCSRCGTRFNAVLNLSDTPPDTATPPIPEEGSAPPPPPARPADEAGDSANEHAFNEVFALGEAARADAPSVDGPSAMEAEAVEPAPPEMLAVEAPAPAVDELSLEEAEPVAEELSLAEPEPVVEELSLAEAEPVAEAPALEETKVPAGDLSPEEPAQAVETLSLAESPPAGDSIPAEEPTPDTPDLIVEEPAPVADPLATVASAAAPGAADIVVDEAPPPEPPEEEPVASRAPPDEDEAVAAPTDATDTGEEGHHYAAVAAVVQETEEPRREAAAGTASEPVAEAVEAYDDEHGIELEEPPTGEAPAPEAGDDGRGMDLDVGAALEAAESEVKAAAEPVYDDDHGIEIEIADETGGPAEADEEEDADREAPAASAADWTPPGPGDEEPTVTDMRSMDIPGLLEIESDDSPAETPEEPPEDDLEKTDLNLHDDIGIGKEEEPDELEQSMEFDLPEDKWNEVFSDDLTETAASDEPAPRAKVVAPAADLPPVERPMSEAPPSAPTPPAATPPPPATPAPVAESGPAPDDTTPAAGDAVTRAPSDDDEQSVDVQLIDESDFQGVEEIVLSSEGAKPEAPDFSVPEEPASKEPAEPEVPTFDDTEGDLLVPPTGKISENFVGIGDGLQEDVPSGDGGKDGDLEKLVARPRRRRRAVWITSAVLLLLVLAAQWVHYNRGALLREPAVAPWLEKAYAAAGMDVQADWDVDALKVLDWRAVAAPDGDDTLNIVTEFRNDATFAQPHPRLRVTLEDRWGQRLGTRDFTPLEYLGNDVRRRSLNPGETVTADVRILDPGPEALSFRIDLCLADAKGALSCSGQSP